MPNAVAISKNLNFKYLATSSNFKLMERSPNKQIYSKINYQ